MSPPPARLALAADVPTDLDLKGLKAWFRSLPPDDKRRLGPAFNARKGELEAAKVAHRETPPRDAAGRRRLDISRPTIDGLFHEAWVAANPDRVLAYRLGYLGRTVMMSYLEEAVERETPENRDRLIAAAAAGFDLAFRNGVLVRRHDYVT